MSTETQVVQVEDNLELDANPNEPDSQAHVLLEHNTASVCNLVDYWDGVVNIGGRTGTDKIMRTLYAKWFKEKATDKGTFEKWCSNIAQPFGIRCNRILQANRGLDMTAHETERRFGEDAPQNLLKCFKWMAGLLGSATSNMKDYKDTRKGEPREDAITRLLGS